MFTKIMAAVALTGALWVSGSATSKQLGWTIPCPMSLICSHGSQTSTDCCSSGDVCCDPVSPCCVGETQSQSTPNCCAEK
jgi:hypothetical protein